MEEKKKVRIIPANPEVGGEVNADMRPKRVAAYCRVSTDKEEQEHSFQTQKEMYTQMIMMKPNWRMAGIYADEGITGTCAKKRPGFMKMIDDCRKGKIDIIITKSLSRFSRNNLDALTYTRELKELGIPVIFEKEGLNTMTVSSELLIALFSGISQAESESISMNVKMGIRQSLKKGKVIFAYGRFLGYRKGEDGNPEIVPEEAEIIKRIYNEYLLGKTTGDIARDLEKDGIITPSKGKHWYSSTVRSILKNEKYKGDALLQKTFIKDCISQKTKKNNGELPMYYVENSHPAIISRDIFDRVQEEIAKRNGIPKKIKEQKTELGKYSGKYALSQMLFCGSCGTPYRRCVWSKNGKKKIIWRCISRLTYGDKYCSQSLGVEEYLIHNAIAEAITEKSKQEGITADKILDHIKTYSMQRDCGLIRMKKERLDEINKRIDALTSTDNEAAQNGEYDDEFEKLYSEMYSIKDELEKAESENLKLSESEIDEMKKTMTSFKNHPVEYSDEIVRQLINCIKIMPDRNLIIYFKDGTKIVKGV